jgi:DNA-binding transcriptional LysR family regulator
MRSVFDSRQLLAARVLAETGSFTLAGQKLSLTQSAVSHAIKALEEEVGCELFTRTGRGVRVTPAGKQFLQYADSILDQMETARTLLAPRQGRGKERLRIGVSRWSRDAVLPIVLPAFAREFPSKELAVEAGEFSHHLDLLESGLLDLVFTVRPLRRPGLEFEMLFEDELRFIVAPNHPWARRGRASPEELGGNALLLYLHAHDLPTLLKDYFRQERLSVRHGVEIADASVLKVLVQTGQAVGVVSTALVKEELAQGSLVGVPFGPRRLVQQWGAVRVRERMLAPMERRLIDLYRTAVSGLLGGLTLATGSPVEKKEALAAHAQDERQLKCSGVALAMAGTYNLLSASIAWENFGSILSAAS